MVNKVKVIPRFKADATYSGYVNIIEDSWKIHSFQLSLGKDAQMEFIDSLTLQQLYFPVIDDIMMPTQSAMEFTFSILGFKGSGMFVHAYSDYEINPKLDEGFFDNKVTEIVENANSKDSLFWEKIRPVPLTYEERRDYVKRDSVMEIRNSPQYLDSMDRAANKIKWNALLAGFSLRNSRKKQIISITAPLESFSFNAVNGYIAGLGGFFTREAGKFSSTILSADLRYGFSNRTYYAWGGIERTWSGFYRNRILVNVGRKMVQFNDNNPIQPVFNASLALFNGIHFMKISETDFINAEWQTSPIPGLKIKLRTRLENRSIPQNTLYSSPLIKTKPEFSPNLILPDNQKLNFSENQMFGGTVRLLFTPFTKYSSYPDRRVDLESLWPEIIAEADLRHVTFRGIDAENLIRIEAGFNKSGNLMRLGFYEFSITAGRQVSGTPLSPLDLRHFNGNRLFLCSFGLQEFFLLDYYTYSTSAPFAEAHFRFNFQGLLLNRIPLIRKLMLNEIAGINHLSVSGKNPWTEYYIGLERLNFSLAIAISGKQSALRLGIKI
jgi:hypothetical protein